MHVCRIWVASCVAAWQTKNHKKKTTLVLWKCFETHFYQFQRRISGEPALTYFYMIHSDWQLPIRNCAGISNNLVPTRSNVNAIKVTNWKSLSDCIWFQDWSHLSFKSIVLIHPQPRLFILHLFLDFCSDFFPEWPLNFLSAGFTKWSGWVPYPFEGPYKKRKAVQGKKLHKNWEIIVEWMVRG